MICFFCDKISADYFKCEIKHSMKENGSIKFASYVAMNHGIDKGKPECKISYKVFK